VKYLSEIITARVEEIMMAILYEIQQSGFADRLMSGIVVTGGCAQTANLGNFIYDLSGYRVRTGYPRHLFSFQGCEGITETSAATSIGLIMAAKEDKTLNCAFAKDGYIPETTTTFSEPESKEEIRTTLFSDEDVKVEPKPEPDIIKTPKKTKVKWTERVGKFWGDLYDSVNNEVENEEV
jgi:cell division protein FtsA